MAAVSPDHTPLAKTYHFLYSGNVVYRVVSGVYHCLHHDGRRAGTEHRCHCLSYLSGRLGTAPDGLRLGDVLGAFFYHHDRNVGSVQMDGKRNRVALMRAASMAGV